MLKTTAATGIAAVLPVGDTTSLLNTTKKTTTPHLLENNPFYSKPLSFLLQKLRVCPPWNVDREDILLTLWDRKIISPEEFETLFTKPNDDPMCRKILERLEQQGYAELLEAMTAETLQLLQALYRKRILLQKLMRRRTPIQSSSTPASQSPLALEG